MVHAHMINNGTHGSRVIKKKRRSPGKGLLQLDDEPDHQVILTVNVHGAEGIDPAGDSAVCVSDRWYQTFLWVEHGGKELWTKGVRGLPDPQWNRKGEFRLSSSLLGRGFLHIEVVRIKNDLEVGTSDGIASVSRARIPLPKTVDQKVEGRFGLVKNAGPGVIKAEGHIMLGMKATKPQYLSD